MCHKLYSLNTVSSGKIAEIFSDSIGQVHYLHFILKKGLGMFTK